MYSLNLHIAHGYLDSFLKKIIYMHACIDRLTDRKILQTHAPRYRSAGRQTDRHTDRQSRQTKERKKERKKEGKKERKKERKKETQNRCDVDIDK